MSQQINLFNPIFLKEKKHFSALTMAQALGVIVLCVFLMFAFSLFQSRSMNQEAVKAATQLADAQQQITKINAELGARKKNQALADEAKRVQDEQAALQQAVTRLQNDEFGGRKGYSAYLRAFARQIVDGVWLTGFSIDGSGSAIGIQGRALQPEAIPVYISRLKQEPVMQGKSFATLEIQQPQKDAERKPQDATVEPKKDEGPQFVEFDLRAAGVEKPQPKNAAPAAPAAALPMPASAPALVPSPAASAVGGKGP